MHLDIGTIMVPLWHVEKRKPSFDLAQFVKVCGDPARLAITSTALRTASELGYGRQDITAAIRVMKPAHFYKSMTSNRDHRRWQDVYHVPHDGLLLYVKFTDDVVTEFVVLSLKER
jgi:motility quorum-sensing regulator/GCU-specific mRNA interferase toxin